MTAISAFPETADIETSSDDYARRFSGAVGAWFLKLQEEATLQMLRPYPGARILDVGGGHGQLTGALVRSGYQVTVLGSAESCKQRIQPFLDSGQCAFEVGNVIDLPYPDRSFDVVISYRLVPHVVRWQQLLREFSRVARQAVIVDYPSVTSVNYIAPQLFRFKKGLEGNTRPFTCFRHRELLDVFAAASFRQAERFPEFMLPMVLHRALKRPALSDAMERVCRRLGLTAAFGSPVILKVVRSAA